MAKTVYKLELDEFEISELQSLVEQQKHVEKACRVLSFLTVSSLEKKLHQARRTPYVAHSTVVRFNTGYAPRAARNSGSTINRKQAQVSRAKRHRDRGDQG